MNSKMKEDVMVLIHTGTVLFCRVTTNVSKTSLHVFFNTESKGEGEKPDQIIPVDDKSPIDLFCPSIEGTVIWCQLRSGEERFYDTRTGELFTEETLKARNKVEEIHFYQ